MVFTPNINVSSGTYVTDGLRSGPTYQNDKNAAYSRLGKGVLYSPYNTWDIVPYESNDGNIVADSQITASGNLTFTEDRYATTLQKDGSGVNYVQFDWPRVPKIVVSGTGMVGNTAVTIFGKDWYGVPMQHRYENIQAAGVYPETLATPQKAFYTITRIYIDGACNPGGTLRIQTSNTFGLPYVIKEKSYAANFSWNGTSMLNQYGLAPLVTGSVTVRTPAVLAAVGLTPASTIITSRQTTTTPGTMNHLRISAITDRTSFIIQSDAADVSVVSWLIPNGGENLISAADTNPAGRLTGDVRGLIRLPDINETWAAEPDGATRLVYTPYIYGADQFINQLSYGGQPEGFEVDGPSTLPALTASDLYGVDQFYTGTP